MCPTIVQGMRGTCSSAGPAPKGANTLEVAHIEECSDMYQMVKAKAADMERKKIKKDEKIEMLQGLGEEDFDESVVETHRQLAQTRGTTKTSKDWLGTRCVCPYSASIDHL